MITNLLASITVALVTNVTERIERNNSVNPAIYITPPEAYQAFVDGARESTKVKIVTTQIRRHRTLTVRFEGKPQTVLLDDELISETRQTFAPTSGWSLQSTTTSTNTPGIPGNRWPTNSISFGDAAASRWISRNY